MCVRSRCPEPRCALRSWSPLPGLNWRPRPYQGRALPTELRGPIPPCDVLPTGAGNGIRTRDIQLGRLTLYQLSYSRNLLAPRDLFPQGEVVTSSGGGWI